MGTLVEMGVGVAASSLGGVVATLVELVGAPVQALTAKMITRKNHKKDLEPDMIHLA